MVVSRSTKTLSARTERINFKHLNDDELHSASQRIAAKERAVTLELLNHLAEIERRHLFSKFSCSSLHAYCVKYLKMSDPQAGRRVAASRMLNEIPALKKKVANGELSMTSVCQASSFFHREKNAGRRILSAEKLEVMNALENQSTRKVEQILISRASNPDLHMRESVKQKTDALTEIKIIADQKMLADLNRLKEVWSHTMPGSNYSQLIQRLAASAVEALDPVLKAKRASARAEKRAESALDQNSDSCCAPDENELKLNNPKINESRSRNVAATVRHAVWVRDGGRCTFTNEQTGEICDSKHYVELDHIKPFANGGEHRVENLRLRCRAHNHRHSIETYGSQTANRWRAGRAPSVREIEHRYVVASQRLRHSMV